MGRYFNTAGPCRNELHYMLPAADRVKHVRSLIEKQLYFVIHAPRQVGKTTSMLALAKQLTEEGTYASMVLTCEQSVVFRDEVKESEAALISSWQNQAEDLLPPELLPPRARRGTPGNGIRGFLRAWAKVCPRPLVLFIDEIDSLENLALINLLRQLRAGYTNRPLSFPHSIALFGMRDTAVADHPRRRDPVEEGLPQLDRYLEGLSWPEGWEGSDTFQAWLFVTEQNPAWMQGDDPPPPVRTEWRLTPGQRKVLVIWG